MLRFLILLVSLAVLRPWVCSAQVNGNAGDFTFSGHIKGRDTGILILGYINKDGVSILDTAKVDNGFFKFQGTVSQPTYAQFTGNVKSKSFSDPNRVQIFLEASKMDVDLTEDQFQAIRVTGSGTQLEFDSVQRMTRKYMDTISEILVSMRSMQKKIKEEGTSKALEDKLVASEQEVRLVTQHAQDAKYRFIKSKPDSYISAFLLTGFTNTISPDTLKAIYAGFSRPVQESMFGKSIQHLIGDKVLSAVGGRAYDFITKDWKGNTLSLAQFKGKKYVLLDFWASWCGPCHEQTPYLNKLYKLYHEKGLEVIGVSGDSNDEVWNKAIQADGVGHWQHISSGRGRNVKDEEAIEKKYAIGTYPTLILIDKDGKIVFREEGYSEIKLKELEDLLTRLL
ncbi:thiol:disulfide interchange protein [Pedobacter sp. BAL39]|uniref:AhpC/TSA family protein n=1 Tax=Pedobacter sp. BAL39 TaxID=391596 RepID=UPI000155944B|nr:AhpC/TSA family protein [Pedobacter sp. BAL39]EDM35385.1 thiol:disulfide interchange protein [Pedobacter sp. BAL39]